MIIDRDSAFVWYTGVSDLLPLEGEAGAGGALRRDHGCGGTGPALGGNAFTDF